MVHRKDVEDAGKGFFPLALSFMPQSIISVSFSISERKCNLKSIIDLYSRKKAQNIQRVEFAYKNGKTNSLLTQKKQKQMKLTLDWRRPRGLF